MRVAFAMVTPTSYMHCIASDMGPAVLKTTNTYQDIGVMKPLLTLQCFDGKICPSGPWHLFLKDCFPLSDRKARCLSASFSASEATVRVMQALVFPGPGGSGRRFGMEDGLEGSRLWWEKGQIAVTTVPDLRFRASKGHSHLRPSEGDLGSLGNPLLPRRHLPYIYLAGWKFRQPYCPAAAATCSLAMWLSRCIQQ